MCCIRLGPHWSYPVTQSFPQFLQQHNKDKQRSQDKQNAGCIWLCHKLGVTEHRTRPSHTPGKHLLDIFCKGPGHCLLVFLQGFLPPFSYVGLSCDLPPQILSAPLPHALLSLSLAPSVQGENKQFIALDSHAFGGLTFCPEQHIKIFSWTKPISSSERDSRTSC